MTEQLPPDVRDRAAQAASDARREYDNATLYVNEAGRNLHIADAVVSVVAEEIARPLQARIVEMEAENDRLRRTSIVDNAYGPGIKVEFDDA